MKLKLMEIQKITSAQNQTIKQIAKLSQSAKARREAGQVVLDGEHLCQEWTGSFVHLIVTEEFRHSPQFAPFANKATIEVPDQLMSKMAPTKTPSGILGVIENPSLTQVRTPVESGLILLLESIQDPGNIGTIIRTAAATDVDTIYLNSECADVWNPKVLRAGMGGHFKLQLVENFDLCTIKTVFDGSLVGTFMEGENLFNTPLPKRCGFVLGNEGAGISPALKKLCDHQVSIPMQNGVESLNVAMAAGLCMYEYMRQRNN